MEFPPLVYAHFLLSILIFILLFNAIFAQIRLEKFALFDLKANFNDPFLNTNWNGPHCPLELPTKWYGIRCVNGRVSGILLENMGLKGTVNSNAFSVFTELTILSFRNNFISGDVMNFSSNQKIKEINLSGNEFQGLISQSLLSLNFLESLQLQDNNLTGYIPEFNQPSLKFFNVSYNNLYGSIPKTSTLQKFGLDSYSNNPELCGPPTETGCTLNDTAETNTVVYPSSSSSKTNKIGTLFLLFDIVGLVAVILLFVLYFRKEKKLKKMLKERNLEEGKQQLQQQEEEEEETAAEDDDSEVQQNRNANRFEVQGREVLVVGEEKGKLIFLEKEVSFGLNDLLKASAEGLGKGIFGNSYKAMMEGMPAVVVKRLRDLKPLTIEEFMKHLNVIADQKHPNLLPILACYYSKEEKLLVYKFAERGNLFNRIHGGRGNKDRIPFRWNERLSVARGVARALEYLHLNNRSSQSVVPHGNLKSSNVLLDDNEMVLVSDYGLTSLIALPIASNRMVSYKSPEYQNLKRVSNKSDVWSYGCLVLELLTGKVPAHSAPSGSNGVDLGSWVNRAVREEWTAEIFDIELSVQRSSTPGMLKLLQIAMRCSNKSPEQRPEMTEVVRQVENINVIESEEEEEDLSLDQSLTDESLSTSTPGVMGDES